MRFFSSFSGASVQFYSVQWAKMKVRSESVFWVLSPVFPLIGIAKVTVHILQKLQSNVQCLKSLFHSLAA